MGWLNSPTLYEYIYLVRLPYRSTGNFIAIDSENLLVSVKWTSAIIAKYGQG